MLPGLWRVGDECSSQLPELPDTGCPLRALCPPPPQHLTSQSSLLLARAPPLPICPMTPRWTELADAWGCCPQAPSLVLCVGGSVHSEVLQPPTGLSVPPSFARLPWALTQSRPAARFDPRHAAALLRSVQSYRTGPVFLVQNYDMRFSDNTSQTMLCPCKMKRNPCCSCREAGIFPPRPSAPPPGPCRVLPSPPPFTSIHSASAHR